MKKNTLRIICMLFICNMVILSNLHAQDTIQISTVVSIADTNNTDPEASYKGGQPGLRDYLIKSITFPKKAEEEESSTILKFKMHIATDGTPSIVEFINAEADNPVRTQLEAIVPNMPKWEPAKKYGTPIESQLTVEMLYEREQLMSVIYEETEASRGMDIAVLRSHTVKKQPSDIEEKPFVTVEQMPMYVGGETKMLEFIEANMQYPEVSRENGVQGRVTVRFVVNRDGSISKVTIMRGVDPACDKEAIRIVKAMPNWVAGRQNNKAVPVYFVLPITFKLNEQESSVK